jgi:hypothetical protein
MLPASTTDRSPVGGQDLTSNVSAWPASKNSAWIWKVHTCGSFLVTGLGSPAPSWILTVPLLPDAANANCVTPNAATSTATTASPSNTFVLDVRNPAICQPALPPVPAPHDRLPRSTTSVACRPKERGVMPCVTAQIGIESVTARGRVTAAFTEEPGRQHPAGRRTALNQAGLGLPTAAVMRASTAAIRRSRSRMSATRSAASCRRVMAVRADGERVNSH